MATEIKMPQLSDTMNSGKILTWLKKEGDQISRGDILAEVETDKANLEIESFFSGTLLQINIQAGGVANVGEAIAFLGEPGEKVNGAAKPAETPAEAPKAVEVQQPAAPVQSAPVQNESHSDSDRIKASPLAKKIAENNNIDLNNIVGSGPSGRIVKKDVEANALAPAKTETKPEAKPEVKPERTVKPVQAGYQPLSKMRQTIARRMQESVNTNPHFYVTTSINMSEAVKFRALLKPREEFKGISINHLVIKATAFAIAQEPRINFAMKDDQLYNPGEINLGIITAIDDGLLIPVLKQADQLSLKDLVFEARAAIDRARAGRPTSADLSGGTFSISNMGMFDVESFTAIINPGQGAILAISAMQDTVVAVDGLPTVAPVLKATVSADHRIIDGIISATFLKHFKRALENPALLLL